jgi:Tol biopolymer transport system component
MGLTIGTQLGSHEITALLGKGGMGEVYRARDLKLKREVAIKILPEEFSRDADRVSRFQREAEVLASLNHPNIAAIFDLQEVNDTRFLVLELVEGETLAERIQRCPIPVEEALEITKHICEALEAAHEKGIVHRDVKPANIKVTPDGNVKVLDFGLAKAYEREEADAALSNSPTLSMAATNAGVILGTAAYMSPEQARGRAADKRTDIWALGCVLYEMLAGKVAFGGDDITDIIASVVKSDPDWGALPLRTPAPILRLLHRCLEKDRKKRLFDIGDARLDIDEALVGSPPADVTPIASLRRERILWVSAVVILVLGSAAAMLWTKRPAPPAPEMRVEITTPSTSDPLSVAISPDGQKIVFLATSEGRSRLWLRWLDSGSVRLLEKTEGASFPFWSPDNRSIGFFANGSLKRLDIDSGLVQELAKAPAGRGGTWNSAGAILFAPNVNGPIFRVSSAGGDAVPVTRIDVATSAVGHRSPQFLPDGRHYLYFVIGGSQYGSVQVGQLDSTETKQLLTNADAGAIYAAGHLFYLRQQTLFAHPFDPVRLEVTGSPVPIAQQIAMGPSIAALSVSAAGTVAYRNGAATGRRQLAWFDRTGKQIERVGESSFFRDPALSSDGSYVALSRQIDGNPGIWLVDAKRGVLREFTSGGAFVFPTWSPDGSRIVFSSTQQQRNVLDLFVKPVTGAGREELLLETPQMKAPQDWSPDGRFIVFRSVDPKTGNDLLAISLDDRKPFSIAQTSFDEREGQFSPDGKWVAFVSNESGRYEIYVQAFPVPGHKISISSTGGVQPRWRRDGKELFYLALDGQLMAVSIQITANGELVGRAPMPLFATNIGGSVQTNNRQQYDVSADGQRFLMNTILEEAAAPITLVLNWHAPAK